METATKAVKLVLEEYSYDAKPQAFVDTLAAWLGTNALPDGDEYKAWRDRLPGHLVILQDEVFRDFARFSTEVITRVRLDTATKTVEPGALWTEESLPAESLLYAPLHAMQTRQNVDPNTNQRISGAAQRLSAEDVLTTLAGLGLRRVRLGGDETVGRGIVYVRWSPQTTPGKE
jgi:CRISPR-associated protein Cmr4